MHIFYCPDIASNQALLTPEESAHCIRVMRLRAGDKVQLIDGKGNLFEATITIPDAQQCRLEITARLPVSHPRNFNLHIAIAPTKNMDRFEWFIEKAVEIGIDTITPLLCQRSERRMLKTERLHKLIISTMKQAMVNKLPLLNELTAYNQFIKSFSDPSANRFIAHCNESERKTLKQELLSGTDVVVFIGPEGDFSPEEVEQAVEKGFIPISLGYNRLRTETAGVVVCSQFSSINNNALS